MNELTEEMIQSMREDAKMWSRNESGCEAYMKFGHCPYSHIGGCGVKSKYSCDGEDENQ